MKRSFGVCASDTKFFNTTHKVKATKSKPAVDGEENLWRAQDAGALFHGGNDRELDSHHGQVVVSLQMAIN